MKENISLGLKNVESFISSEEILALAQQSVLHLDSLNKRTGAGSDFLGWMSLPEDVRPQLDRIEKVAERLRSISDLTVIVGIGGSYLGSRAVIEALSHSFTSLRKEKHHEIVFAGQNLSEDYLSELLDILDVRNYSIVVISKSGVTTEPAIAFRIIKNHLEKKVGKKEASERIVAITDSKKGALRPLADANGYETFVIPDNIGGRYSVLTPAGLLPVALSGIDIRMLVEGAASMQAITRNNKNAATNPSLIYAAARNTHTFAMGLTAESKRMVLRLAQNASKYGISAYTFASQTNSKTHAARYESLSFTLNTMLKSSGNKCISFKTKWAHAKRFSRDASTLINSLWNSSKVIYNLLFLII